MDYLIGDLKDLPKKFEPNSRLLLQGELTGSIALNEQNCTGPIEITSAGSRAAQITTCENHPGIEIQNISGVKIHNLYLKGAGRAGTPQSDSNFLQHGILVENTGLRSDGPEPMRDLLIQDVQVEGFHQHGIWVYSAADNCGIQGVKILDCTAHHNGRSGITVGAVEYPGTPHGDILVARCLAYENCGIPGQPVHTGSGIVISGFRTGVIEYSEAFENGRVSDASETGGPAGIWAYNSDGAIIRHNRSHHNHSANNADGGGYDLDGGTRNAKLYSNLSWANDGYGYQVWDFFWGETSGNEVFSNVSILDCARYPFGAFVVFGCVNDSRIHDNIAHVRPGAKLVEIRKWTGRNLQIYRNQYVSEGSVIPLSQDGDSTGSMLRMHDETVLIAP